MCVYIDLALLVFLLVFLLQREVERSGLENNYLPHTICLPIFQHYGPTPRFLGTITLFPNVYAYVDEVFVCLLLHVHIANSNKVSHTYVYVSIAYVYFLKIPLLLAHCFQGISRSMKLATFIHCV